MAPQKSGGKSKAASDAAAANTQQGGTQKAPMQTRSQKAGLQVNNEFFILLFNVFVN